MRLLLVLSTIFMLVSCQVTRHYRDEELPAPTEIVIFDDFSRPDVHGQEVMEVADNWSLHSCTIRCVHTNRREDDYNEKLAGIVKRVEQNPEVRYVINISLASPRYSEVEARLIRRLSRHNAIVVSGSGNNGKEIRLYPSALDSVMAVAATCHGRKADYSNYGSHIAICVDTSSRVHVERYVEYDAVDGLVEYVHSTIVSGTSLASPKLAGMLGLAWASNPGMTKDELMAAMNRCAREVDHRAFLKGKLGAGELDCAWFMFENSKRPGKMAGLLILESVVFAVLCTIARRDWAATIFSIIVALLLLVPILWLAGIYMALEYGHIYMVVTVTLAMMICIWRSDPLEGKLISMTYEAHRLGEQKAMALAGYLQNMGAEVEVRAGPEDRSAPGVRCHVHLHGDSCRVTYKPIWFIRRHAMLTEKMPQWMSDDTLLHQWRTCMGYRITTLLERI